MSLSFPASTRAIKASGRRLSLFGLTVALLLVIAWIVWLFQGTITLYESSFPVRINRDALLDTPVVAATFPASAVAFIQQGQQTYLWLESDTGVYPTPIQVQIYDIQVSSEHQPLQTTIWIPSYDAIAALPTEPLIGRVRIVAGQVHPIMLFLQEIGWLNTPPPNAQKQSKLNPVQEQAFPRLGRLQTISRGLANPLFYRIT